MHGMMDNVKAAQNPDERYDVVDEADRVLRQATRREVHAHGWLHRAVHVLMFDSQGRVFLQKRSLAKDTAPGTWSASCSGHVDAGEDYDTAAFRELGEEIGVIPAEPPVRWLRFRACPETSNEFTWVYRLQYEGPVRLDPAEVETGEWVSASEVTQGILERPQEYAEAFRHIWQRAAMEL